MRNLFLCLTPFILFILSCNSRSGDARVLVFSKTAGYVHSSIPSGVKAIRELGASNKFIVDTTRDAAYFNEDSLKKYAAVIFLNTTGDILDHKQATALERYIQAGGGFVGVHAAADAEYDWAWYGRLVGGYFESHPAIQKANIIVKDKDHASTKGLPETWSTTDEWYNYKKISKDIHVVLALDEKSYEGGKNGENHPIAWYQDFDGGRAFYTGLGHVEENYTNQQFLNHLLGGIQYAIGDNKELDFGDAKSEYAPDEDRFTKTILTQGTLFEPTEITVLPNLDVLIGQRRGEILLYKNETKALKQAGFLNVYWKTLRTPGVNAEEGLLGIQADPDFKKNNWIYVFYSPADTSVNRLSRFEFKNDTIDPKSEKVILQLYSQREICCHTGGSIAFGKDKLLYLSTGDNSTPFNEPNSAFVNHGFAPLDNRPGHHQYDARRSAGNTNDLRGKILRIKINDDATYSIPEGNLFPGKSDKTRPEIFVMGDRNPYRITVDKRTGFVYWGEVGPDAANDSMDTRGPRGYDEVNQARKAGFFGWPLFIGNNYAYREYDYNTGKSGALFDPQRPVNNSINNTGLQELPPAQPAFIWYPYAASNEFPQVGSGGRTAMAGPVYYGDEYPKDTRYADYFNGKLFIYEWIRGWIKVVTMSPDGDLEKIEPFMQTTKFAAPQDMEVGPDGKLYVLEYGSGWFAKNPDAALSRIDFNSGNRPPKVANLKVNQTSGALPFKLTATVEAKDPENDKLTYIWNTGDGNKKETTDAELEYAYNKAGDYAISVEVVDDNKASAKSESVSIYAGNEAPDVDIKIAGNQSVYFPSSPINYEVVVKDKDQPGIEPANLRVLADFVEGRDKAAVPVGHLSVSETEMGRNIMLTYDCKACHKVDEKSVGPAYTAVAMKYKTDPKASAYLIEKIRKGGGGVWGEVAMSAHPDIPENDLQQIVKWILSLSAAGQEKKSLKPSGTITPPANSKGQLYFTAMYTDNGGNGIKPLTGKKTLVLRNNQLSMREVKDVNGFTRKDSSGTRYLQLPAATGSLMIDSMDLTGLGGVQLNMLIQQPVSSGYFISLHVDAANGTKVGEQLIANTKASKATVKLTIPFTGATSGFHKIYLVATPVGNEKTRPLIESLQFRPRSI
jgi:cytochrome c